MVRALLCVLFLGCSSPAIATEAVDASPEVPRAGVYYSDPGAASPCGWVSLPARDGEVVDDIFLPCGGAARDPVSDRPESEEEHPNVPQGWSPPGPPGDPVPW